MSNRLILRTAGVGLAAIVSLAAQPLKAQASSDAERIEKLERAVQALQQRNAQLESEVSGLEEDTERVRRSVASRRAKKTEMTYDGQEIRGENRSLGDVGADKWKLSTC